MRAGHAVYDVVRNVMEMLQYSCGSTDLAGLVDFVEWEEGGMKPLSETLINWFDDDAPLSKWADVTTDSENRITEVDAHLVDPTFVYPIAGCLT